MRVLGSSLVKYPEPGSDYPSGVHDILPGFVFLGGIRVAQSYVIYHIFVYCLCFPPFLCCGVSLFLLSYEFECLSGIFHLSFMLLIFGYPNYFSKCTLNSNNHLILIENNTMQVILHTIIRSNIGNCAGKIDR